MRILVAACMLSLAGCSSNLHLVAPDGPTAGTGPGQSASRGWLEVITPANALAAALFGLGVLAVLGDDPAVMRAPVFPMDPHRSINEQDCTQPVDISAGNLRCR